MQNKFLLTLADLFKIESFETFKPLIICVINCMQSMVNVSNTLLSLLYDFNIASLFAVENFDHVFYAIRLI